MPQQQDRDERVANLVIDRVVPEARRVSQLLDRTYGRKQLTAAEELAVWRHRAMSPEDEAMAWQQAQMQDVPYEQAAAQIAQQVYPDRHRLMKAGGRITLEEQAAYVKRMAERAQQADDAEREQKVRAVLSMADRVPAAQLVGDQPPGPPPMGGPSMSGPPPPMPGGPPPPAEPPY